MNTSTERSAVASGEVFFQQLPVFDPDPALWVRIQALDQRHRQRRRIRFAALAGGLATLLAALALVVPGGPWHPAESADLALRQATSQQLQEQMERDRADSLAALAGGGPVPAPRLPSISAQAWRLR